MIPPAPLVEASQTMPGPLEKEEYRDETDLHFQVSLDIVDVLDINSVYRSVDSSAWYQQSTRGDVPSPRMDFCVAAVSAADNSSHHLYVYGGRDHAGIFDDVYLLTIPSFEWVKLYSGKSPRAFHTCAIYGHYMLTVGGANDTNFMRGCDWEQSRVGVWDLNTAKWGQTYRSDRVQYKVPGQVIAIVGGG